jgi:hypothetical protein
MAGINFRVQSAAADVLGNPRCRKVCRSLQSIQSMDCRRPLQAHAAAAARAISRVFRTQRAVPAALIDAQRTRLAQCGETGIDADKKVQGRERNFVGVTLGLTLAVRITAASVQDRGAPADGRPLHSNARRR